MLALEPIVLCFLAYLTLVVSMDQATPRQLFTDSPRLLAYSLSYCLVRSSRELAVHSPGGCRDADLAM